MDHPKSIKKHLKSLSFENVDLRWMNNESMQLITSFGKDIYLDEQDSIKINRIHDPVLYRYYLDGNWEIYYKMLRNKLLAK